MIFIKRLFTEKETTSFCALDPSTKGWVLSAIGKLTSQMGQLLGNTRDVLEKYRNVVDVDLRQVSGNVCSNLVSADVLLHTMVTYTKSSSAPALLKLSWNCYKRTCTW